MKITMFKGLIAAIFALALVAGCGGGRYSTPDPTSGGGTTPSATYAEFVGKTLVIHFETPVSVEASLSKALAASNFSITEDLTGLPVTLNRIVPASDGSSVEVYAAFQYLTGYNIATSGLVGADGAAIEDLSLSAESPANPRSLSNGRYSELFVAISGMAAIISGPDLVPVSEDSNEVDFMSLLGVSWMYQDPFSPDCSVGSESLNIPGFMVLGNGHSFMVARVGTARDCGDIFAGGSPGISVGKGAILDPRTTFLYFDDKDAGPVAEFMPEGSSLVLPFPLVSPPFDFNGDGVADFAFVETSEADLMEEKAGIQLEGHEYLRIFFGRASGGFAGRIESSEADVTIPVEGFSETMSVYDAWMRTLGMGLVLPYYPALSHGDLDGDGFDDIAVAVYDTSLGRMVVKIWMGAAEAGVRGDPDSLVSAPGNQTYPEMVPNMMLADVNGDGMHDLVLGSTFEIAPYVERAPATQDPGMVQILLGRNPWPARLSTASADARIIEEKAQDELGRLTALGMIQSDYNNDGYDDMLIAAPRTIYDTVDRVYRGKVYLFLGGPDIGTDAAWDEMPAGDADMIFLSDATQDILAGTGMWDPGDLLNDGNPDVFIATGRRGGAAIAAMYFYNLDDGSAGVYGPADAKSIIVVGF